MTIENIFQEGLEPPKCIRCGHPLVQDSECDSFEDEGIYNLKCEHCGALHDICLPQDEEDKAEHPYWNGDHSSDGGCGYGYDAICPVCRDEDGEHSHYMIWQSDYNFSECFGLIEGAESSDGYYPDDDNYESLATALYCPHCGTMVTVGDCVPAHRHLYPAYEEYDGNKQQTDENE